MRSSQIRHNSSWIGLQKTLLLGTAISFSLLPQLSYGQATPGSQPSASSGDVEVVTVTAERRTEPLVKVPVTVTTLTGAQLDQEGIVNSRDLALVSPGLILSGTGGTTAPFLRGVGTSVTGVGSEPNVATYIDGFYWSSQSSGVYDLPDITQIQVLKGPQGTLFGRNAMGGAILITTVDPTSAPTASVTVGGGNYDAFTVKGYYAGPIDGDTLTGSLSMYWDGDQGYDHNIRDNKMVGQLDMKGVKGKLKFAPTDDFSVKLTVFDSYSRDDSGVYGLELGGNSLGVAKGHGTIAGTKPWQTAQNLGLIASGETGASVVADYNMGWSDLSSTVTGSHQENKIWFDYDYTSAQLGYFNPTYPDDTITWENLIKSASDQRFRWLAGTYFYYDNTGYNPLPAGSVFGAPGTAVTRAFFADHSYAIYGNLDYDITDALTVSAGDRYNIETKSFDGKRGTLAAPPPFEDQLPFINKDTWVRATPEGSIRYAVNSDSNIYLTYGEGFHSGSFNGSALVTLPFNPEYLKAWEAGFKTDHGSWAFDFAGFSQRLTNQQITAFVQITPTQGVSETVNAGAADMYGIDSDMRWRLDDQFSVTAAGEYLHATYSNFTNAIINVPQTAAHCAGNGFTYPCGNATVDNANVTGNFLQRAPQLTGNITPQFDQDIPYGHFMASMTAFYTSKYYMEVGDRVAQAPYMQLNAQMTFTPTGMPWNVTLWGNNLTNRAIIETAYVSAFGDGVSYAPPLMYGVRFNYAF